MMLSKRSATSEFLHEQFRRQSLDLAPSIELNSNDLLLDLARIGLGIACIPDYCFREDSELRELSLAEPLPARQLLLAYDDARPLTPAAEALKAMLAADK